MTVLELLAPLLLLLLLFVAVVVVVWLLLLALPDDSRGLRRDGVGVVLGLLFDVVVKLVVVVVCIDEGYSLPVVVFALVTMVVVLLLLLVSWLLSLGLVPFVVLACVAAIRAEARFSGDIGGGCCCCCCWAEPNLLLLDRLEVLRTMVLCGLMLS